MKALGLSFSLFVFASLAAPPAEAHFRAGFHPSARIGPTHGGDLRNGFRRQRNQQGGSGSDWTALPDTADAPDTPSDAAPGAAPPQYVPVPVPVPYGIGRWTPSHPRLILIGEQQRPHGAMPKVVYGDPLPEEGARP
jgi:hypothetical protein